MSEQVEFDRNPEAGDFREQMREMFENANPDESVHDLSEVNFAEHVAQGRKTLLLDAEGTFVETGAWDVDDKMISTIQQARQAGIQNVAIITNKRPKNDTEWTRLAWWGDQIGADVVFTPLFEGDRKPRPTMVTRALEHFGVSADSALMAGDKASADILAANRAGVHSVWVDRLGKADLTGDRLFRRPIEKAWRFFVKKNPRLQEIEKDIPNVVLDYDSALNVKSEPPQEIVDLDLIFGFGNLDIPVTPESELLPEGVEQQVSEFIDQKSKVESFVEKQIEKHGGLIADALTLSRIPLGFAVAGAILKEKWILAGSLHALAQATDWLDGKFADASQDDSDSGNRKRGGKWDATVDKIYATLVSLALVAKGRKSIPNFAMQMGREVLRESQRKYYKENYPELDTRATASGKASTAAVAVADEFAMLFHQDSMEPAREIVHTVATLMKGASLELSPRKWHAREADKQEAAKRLEILRAKPI